MFDIGIIGGGISGLGVAYEATRRGYKTILIEQSNTLASRTSDNSLRIIHGGFRYFQKLQFTRVVESIRAQQELLNLFPEFIKPLSCILPLTSSIGTVSPLTVIPATALYNFTSLILTGKSNGAKFISSNEMKSLTSFLTPFSKFGGCVWQDAQLTSPSSFSAHLRLEFEKGGGVCVLNEHIDSVENITAKSRSGKLFDARVWIETLGASSLTTKHKTCTGFNLVFNGENEIEYAVALPGPGRFYFLTPRQKEFAIGTWYLPGDETLAQHHIDTALQEIAHILPQNDRFSKENLLRIESGDLIAREGATPQDVRSITQSKNLISIHATKYTTFLPQARDALDRAAALLN